MPGTPGWSCPQREGPGLGPSGPEKGVMEDGLTGEDTKDTDCNSEMDQDTFSLKKTRMEFNLKYTVIVLNSVKIQTIHYLSLNIDVIS